MKGAARRPVSYSKGTAELALRAGLPATLSSQFGIVTNRLPPHVHIPRRAERLRTWGQLASESPTSYTLAQFETQNLRQIGRRLRVPAGSDEAGRGTGGKSRLIPPNVHLLPPAASGTAETSSISEHGRCYLNVSDKGLMRDLCDVVTVLSLVGGIKVKNLLSFQESHF